MNEITTFSPEQQVVLDLIREGKSIGAAAHAAGIHRNTVANWRRTSEEFRKSYDQAHYDQVMACRDRAVDLAPEAMYTIMRLMQDPGNPPGVRLRAALEVQKRAETLPPPDPSAAKTEKLAQSAQAAQTESETAAIFAILNQIMAALDRFIAPRAAEPEPSSGPIPEPALPSPHDLPQAASDKMLASLINLSNQLNPQAAQGAQSAQRAQPAPTKQPQNRDFEQLVGELIEPPSKLSFAGFAAQTADQLTSETTGVIKLAESGTTQALTANLAQS